MALTVGVDTYASTEEATGYLSRRFGVDAWDNADVPTREKALATATLHIDSLTFRGRKKDPAQLLESPRCYVATVEGELTEVCDVDVLPNVRRACIEEALAILEGAGSFRAQLQREGVTSVKMGSTSETYSGAVAERGGLASPEAARFLKPYVAGPGAIG